MGLIKPIAKGKTDIGQVRSVNQDLLLINHKQKIYIVADGMGGHAGGEIASQICVNAINDYLVEHLSDIAVDSDNIADIQSTLKIISDSINHASSKIYEHALQNPTLKGMGTTATVLKIINNRAFCGHVGDSRLYLLRNAFLYQITYDHSLVSEQVRAGLLTEEEAEHHHLKNVITRSVGYQLEEEVDTTHLMLEPNDLLLLCSDGLHGKVPDTEISKITNHSRLDAVNILVNLANERGGEDNITVLIIDNPDVSS